MSSGKRRVGIVGYGHLGQHLFASLASNPDLEPAFVWNRSKAALSALPKEIVLDELENVGEMKPDLIVEVAHPSITEKYGALFLSTCDFMIGSPTALADRAVESALRTAVAKHGSGLYVPSGALWGGEDIRKMADRGTLKGVTVTMRKHPSSFKLTDPEMSKRNDAVSDVAVTLYDGPVRALCPIAPNNVNTMAAASIAAHNLGLDETKGRLISDPNLPDWHEVEVDVVGPMKPDGREFRVTTLRRNPADPGAVTGSATYNSFVSSMIKAVGKGEGVHLC